MRALRRSLKISFAVGGGIILLALLFAFFSQTQFFKDRLRGIIISALADRMNGTFVLGTIRGNFITGFSIDSLDISYDNRPVLRTGEVSFRYEILPLFRKKFHAHALHIDRPLILLRRSRDSVWNFSRVMKPGADTTVGTFTWSGAFDTIDLRNGVLTVDDSLSSPPSEPRAFPALDYHRFTLTGINLGVSATAFPGSYEVRIYHASCRLERPSFDLKQFQGQFAYDSAGIRISHLNIVTGRSALDLDVALRGERLAEHFTLGRLERDSTRLLLHAHRVDAEELAMFLPELAFLQEPVTLDISAAGAFGNLTVHKCDVGFRQTTLHISGALRNLHDPGQLLITAAVAPSRIVPHDVRKLLPKFSLPPFDSVAVTTVTGEFSGHPVDFTARAAIRGHFGSAEAQCTLNMSDSIPRYAADVTSSGLDLRAIFGPAALSQALTLRAHVEGAGFTPGTLRTTLTASADSSRIRGLTVEHADLSVNAADRHISSTLALSTPESRADVNARLDLTSPDVPLFASEFSLSSVDLAPLLLDDRYRSDLYLRGTVEGSGRKIDDISTELGITFLPSKFNGHDIRSDELHLSLDQHDPGHKHLTMTSSIADAELDGRFDLDLIAASLADRIPMLIQAFRDHTAPGAVPPPRKQPAIFASHTEQQQTMDFRYHLQCKDLQPVTNLIELDNLSTVAELSGRIRMTPADLSLTCDGTVTDFFLGTASGGVAFSGATVAVALDSVRRDATLSHLLTGATVRLASADIGDLHLDNAEGGFTYKNGAGTFSASGICDSLYDISLKGQVSTQPDTYVFDLDSLVTGLGSHRWINRQDIQCRLNAEGLRVMHAEMVHDDAGVEAAGILRSSGDLQGRISLRRFNLQELNLWLPLDRMHPGLQNFLGTAGADISLGGTFSNPVLDLGVHCRHVTYKQTPIGTVDAVIGYRDTLARLDVTLHGEGDDSLSMLTLRGDLPIDLTATDTAARFPGRPQHLTLTSKRFDLGIFDPLIGEVDDLTGKLSANVQIEGTPGAPVFSGLMQLRDVNFVFTPNNVRYRLEGDLEPSGDRIILRNFLLRNNPAEGRQGEARMTGSLTMKDYGISAFEVTAFGQLLLMSEATRQTGISFSGILLTETDSSGMTMKGSFAQPTLSGNLFVRDANLTFPPTNQNVLSGNQLKVHYVVIDDTTARRPSRMKTRRPPWLSQQTDSSKTATAEHGNIFLDRLRYNVTVETKGTTAIRMIFFPENNEELYAELEGKATIINKEGTPNVYGDITVLPHSYYNYIRRFDATGSLNFVGPWDNPELKIRATYEGYHTVDSLAKSGGNSQQKVTVILDITGKRYEPKPALSMQVQLQPGEPAVDWTTQARGGDVQSDAISFILFNKFSDEITSADRRSLAADVGSTASSGFTSTLLSGVLTNYLRKELPFIRDVGVTYQGGNPDVRITGDVLNGYLQFGGKILNNISSANVSYQVNLGEFLKNPSIRNLFLEIQHRDSDLTVERKTDEARIYYRFSF